MAIIKEILDSERTFPHQICPFCPVFFVYNISNTMVYNEINNVLYKNPDIG